MRICTSLAILLAAVALTAAPALANEWSLENFKEGSGKSDWEGFGVGTSYSSWSSTTSPMGTQEGEERKTLVKIEVGTSSRKITIKVENKAAGPDAKWVAKEVVQVPKKPATWEQTLQGEEMVKLGEKEFACKKYVLKKTQGKDVEYVTVWESASEGVVRFVAKPEGAPDDLDMRATKLSVDHKIGENTLKCREFSGTMKTGKITMLLSRQSPEYVISMTADMNIQGRKISSRAEITALTLKPLAATTPSTK